MLSNPVKLMRRVTSACSPNGSTAACLNKIGRKTYAQFPGSNILDSSMEYSIKVVCHLISRGGIVNQNVQFSICVLKVVMESVDATLIIQVQLLELWVESQLESMT